MKKYFFVLLIIFIISCQSKNAEKKESIVVKPVSEIEIKKNSDSLIYKIDQNSIVVQDDTLKIEAPFIYSFEGIVEGGKKIQIHISNQLTTEYGGYLKMGDLYIDGENEVFDFAFQKVKGNNYYTSKVEGYYSGENREKKICDLKLYHLSSEEMFIECLYNNKNYKIYPSKKLPSYKCFDIIEYTLFDSREAYKKEEAMREYTPSRSYNFFAEILPNDESFDVLSSNLKYLATDSLDVKSYKKWKHNFNVEKSKGEDENYSSENLDVIAPIFIDSNIFVISSFSYNYMGGAHGIMHTEYDNYDVSTGKKIDIDQILNTVSTDFISFYESRVKSDYGDAVLSSEIPITHNFFILPTGITFSYAPYELLGFAAGEPHLFFTYEELKPFIIKNGILDKYVLN